MPNRLADAPSPYLRQHAHNPVDWYPWGEEALTRARTLDRPLFVSIGYSACHWCHVMERESFDDPAVAEILNEHFVPVKVDREERPDVDGIYMRAVQALTGRGGWPLSAFLTPDGAPFHGGTYYPPEPRHGMPSFRQVLAAVSDAWTNRRGQVEAGAAQLREALGRSVQPLVVAPEGRAPDPGGLDLARDAFQTLRRQFDPVHGGFGGAPKFPQPVTLEFLLALHAATDDDAPLELVVSTLHHMARGGIRDHLGGGFHRYAVDERWLVPHFEKMLYDNALLARVYTDAWKATGLDEFRRVATAVLDDVVGDLRAPEGGFYAARDADSEGEEGVYYLWTPEEVDAVGRHGGLPDSDVALFRRVYDVQAGGNFEGRSILHLPHGLEAEARREGCTVDELEDRLAPVAAALLRARHRREAPFRDEKVLCVWSAFTVRALAEAAVAFDRPDYLEVSVAGGRFLRDHLQVDGRPLRVFMEGRAHVDAFLDDRAALGNAFLTLHETTLEPGWLAHAGAVADDVVARFWSDEDSVLFDAPHDGEALVVRPREILDTATPSGNSLAVELLLRAGHVLGRDDLVAVARRVLDREAGAGRRYPAALGRLLTQVVREASAPVEVALTGPLDDPRTRALVAAAWAGVHPNRSVVGGGADTPLLEGRSSDAPDLGGAPAAWVCRAFACAAPTADPDAVRSAVGGHDRRSP